MLAKKNLPFYNLLLLLLVLLEISKNKIEKISIAQTPANSIYGLLLVGEIAFLRFFRRSHPRFI